jgi:hypothetical protein
MKPGPKPFTRQQWIAGFFKRVRKTEFCWNWTGLHNNKGYGVINRHHSHRMTVASRVSWEIHRGPIPDGLFVCHHCDNPLCVNPEHLFLGTQTDNMQDCKRKGRLNITASERHGELNCNAKLANADISTIHSLCQFLTQQRVADLFGVSQATIWKVLNGWTYKYAT